MLENIPQPKQAAETYLGDDGLLHCTKCGNKIQTIVKIGAIMRKVGCICKCQEKEIEEQKEKERQQELDRARQICFSKTNMKSWNFKNDDCKDSQLSNAMKNYVEKFNEFKKNGKGLLLYGTVGTGKTFYSACIANALIDQGYRRILTV